MQHSPHTVRVASVPAGHVYVRHLSSPSGRDRVVRLPDPPPQRATRADTGVWWPPAMLDADWVDAHADELDLMHVHFGFDALDPADLAAIADALDRHGKPLVLTAHDLRNPHHPDPGLHEAQLDVLLRRAAAVITLTEAAASVLRDRWGVRAHVLPHPHIVDEDWLRRPREPHDGFLVGIHAKSLRANLDPLPVLAAIIEGRDRLPGLRLRVDVHTDVMTEGMQNHDPRTAAQLRRWSAEGQVELHVHDYFTDDELHAYLQGLDVSVLPYRFGSHSGWLEACYDLGTWLAAPTCGFYADQREVLSFGMDQDHFDAGSLLAALERARHEQAPRATLEDRRREREELARAHEEVYRSLLR